VNLSGKSIGDPRTIGFFEDALAEGGIDPACLVFEMTETAAIANLQQARAFVNRMHGCRLALDNFVAGSASFYYLKNFPFDYLKIDGEFIRGLSNNSVNWLVVQAIVGIGQGMGKKTVGTYVADADSVYLLRDNGVDYAQGYHIGLPRPVAEVLLLWRCATNWQFAGNRLSRGLSPPSCRTCSAHKKTRGMKPRAFLQV
jgi:EAL domain-containing protein (putative c-di-GMP-specific phosphodiesterase class I)